MATTDLGKWMITNGGEYNPNTTYEQLTMVLYQNSTYITLRTVTGIIPNNDKINYILMAQGFSANALGDVVAKDTYGVIGDVGGDVSAQNLVDYLTNEVVNNLLKKTSISTVQANSDNTVPSSSLAYAMQQEITKNKEDIATANSNLALKTGAANINSDWATGSANYYAIGKQCVVNALITLKQDTIVNNTLVISGLPISAQEKVCLFHGAGGYGVFKVIADTGNITIDSGAKGSSIFYFEMIYLSK